METVKDCLFAISAGWLGWILGNLTIGDPVMSGIGPLTIGIIVGYLWKKS